MTLMSSSCTTVLWLLFYLFQGQKKDKARLPHHNYVEDYDDKEGSSSVVFTLSERIGALAEALKIFQVRKTQAWYQFNKAC